MANGDVPPSRWYDEDIADFESMEFPVSFRTRVVPKKDPPKLGPHDDQKQWSVIEVCLVMGGVQVSPIVVFPAHEPLSAAVAFQAAFIAMMASRTSLDSGYIKDRTP